MSTKNIETDVCHHPLPQCQVNFQRINDKLDLIIEKQREIREKTEEVYTTVKVSNGKPSLLARVDKLEDIIEKEEKTSLSRKSYYIGVASIIFTAIVTIVAPKIITSVATAFAAK